MEEHRDQIQEIEGQAAELETSVDSEEVNDARGFRYFELAERAKQAGTLHLLKDCASTAWRYPTQS